MEDNVLSLEEIIKSSIFCIDCFYLGKLRFNLIRVKDTDSILELLNTYDGEDFAKYFVLNQLHDSKINYDDLNELKTFELRQILLDYINNEYDFTKFFNFECEDFFQEFKKGITNFILDFDNVNKLYVEDYLKLIKPYESVISSTLQNLAKLNILQFYQNNFKHIIPYQNQAQKIAKDLMHVSGTYMQISKTLVDYSYFMKPLESITRAYHSLDIVASFAETFKRQLDSWYSLFYNNESIIRVYEKSLENWNIFLEKYHLSEHEAINALKKYHWFISPNMDMFIVFRVVNICKSENTHKQKEINNLFYDYFLEDSCQNLVSLVENWESNPLFKRRMKIFKDCVKVVQNTPSNVNFSNLIVPTLISQIDGIQRDFMKSRGFTVNRGVVYNSNGEKLKDKHGQNIKWKTYFKDLTVDDEVLDSINDAFLNILFQDTMPGEDYKDIHFSRHKILHGENVRYGRKDYALRCFMILDFLAELSRV